MDRKDLMLAAMSPAAQGDFSPVQVQKLFFLIDRELCQETGGPFFDFQPYDYGPFDQGVYAELENLEHSGLVEVRNPTFRAQRRYFLTATGLDRGRSAFQGLPENVRDYITRLVKFVRESSFNSLVAAIYKAYPEMKANSVFNG